MFLNESDVGFVSIYMFFFSCMHEKFLLCVFIFVQFFFLVFENGNLMVYVQNDVVLLHSNVSSTEIYSRDFCCFRLDFHLHNIAI